MTRNNVQVEILRNHNSLTNSGVLVTIGGLISGTSLGWTSPATIKLLNGTYGFAVSVDDISWMAGAMPLGAILGCILTGIFIDIIGRKSWLLVLILPNSAGWALMIWAQSPAMFCYGRFLTGIATGSFCMAVPIYTAEISEKEIRGTLGTYLQLQISAGILSMYIIGYYVDVFTLSVICGILPFVFFFLMLFVVPETPYFSTKMENYEKAKKSLTWLRGSNFDAQFELNIIREAVEKDKNEIVSFKEAFQKRAVKRALMIGFGIMFIQQFSGCNAIIFYTVSIFQASGSNLNSSLCTIIIGGLCSIVTWIATLLVDKLGRRMLLLFSTAVMGICLFFLAIYFYLKNDLKMDVVSLGWLPLTSLSVYMAALSMGVAPIPWMLVGEIFPTQVRGCASSIVCLFNWFCVFLVTKFFAVFADMFGMEKVFLFFVLCCLLGVIFIYIFVPETNGKTLEEIQDILGETSANRVYLLTNNDGAGSKEVPQINEGITSKTKF